MNQQGQVLVNRSVEKRWPAIAEELIERTAWSVTLGHPGMVNRMKQNPDKADAWVLADLIRLGPCGA